MNEEKDLSSMQVMCHLNGFHFRRSLLSLINFQIQLFVISMFFFFKCKFNVASYYCKYVSIRKILNQLRVSLYKHYL